MTWIKDILFVEGVAAGLKTDLPCMLSLLIASQAVEHPETTYEDETREYVREI